MASHAEQLKSETAKPTSNVINHPYSSRFKNPLVAPGAGKAAEGRKKHPAVPYEKLLVIADLLK